MLYGGYNLRWEKGQLFVIPAEAIGWLALGALTLGAALWLRHPHPIVFSPEKSIPKPYTINWKWIITGAVALYFFAEANANLLLRGVRFSQHLQVFLFAAGLVAIMRGMGGLHFTRFGYLFRRSNIPLLIITMLALALRVWNLSDTVHMMIDEMHFFNGVSFLRQVNTAPILHPMNSIASFPYTYAYLQSWTVRLFGANFTGMRMASAIVGSLTIPAIYLLGRALFDRKTALIAAVLLAIFPPHIHFSRLALNNIADPLFGTLALAFLVRGLKRNSQSDYVLAGINLGLANYFYEGGRLLFLGTCVGWLGIILVIYCPRTHWRGLILLVIAAVLVMMPYYYTLSRAEYSFTSRFANEAIRPRYLLQDLQTKPLIDVLLAHYDNALKYSIFHTIYSPESSQFYYGGYTGILHWYVVPFYALGLFYLMWRSRAMAMLLWLWIGFAIIGISFVVNADWTVRFVGVFPAMILAVAVGLRYPLEFLWPVRLPRRYLNALIVALIALIGTFQLTHYFGDHLTLYNSQIRLGRLDSYDVFDRAASYLPAGELYYLTDENIFTPVLESVREFSGIHLNYRIWRLDKVSRASLESLPHDRMALFAVAPADVGVISLLHDLFELKGPLWSLYDSVPDDRQYALFISLPNKPQLHY